MKAGQLCSLPLNYSCSSGVLSPVAPCTSLITPLTNPPSQCGKALQADINSCLGLTRFIATDASGCLLLLFEILHFSLSLSLFFPPLWETGATGLAIPLNTLSRSPCSSITRTKTKCSTGCNSVRLVRVQDHRLYTSVSLWCHCGILYRYAHTHTHTHTHTLSFTKVTKQRVIRPWKRINHHGACSRGEKTRVRC